LFGLHFLPPPASIIFWYIVSDRYLIKAGDHNLSTNELSEQEYNYISSVDFDAALVKLGHNVELNRFVRTVCLPEKDKGDLAIPSTDGIAAGWGVTQAIRHGELPKPDDIFTMSSPFKKTSFI